MSKKKEVKDVASLPDNAPATLIYRGQAYVCEVKDFTHLQDIRYLQTGYRGNIVKAIPYNQRIEVTLVIAISAQPFLRKPVKADKPAKCLCKLDAMGTCPVHGLITD